MTLFSRRSLDAVTIDEIAAAADVGKGTIYNYFATKEDIVVAFMADLEAQHGTHDCPALGRDSVRCIASLPITFFCTSG